MIINTQLSNNEHIVRTTQQWEVASVKYKIIPNGCLCVEFTPDGKTKIKVGDGHKYYAQLPYIGGDIDIHEIIALIEEYVDSKEFMEIQEPIIPSVDDLPLTGNDVGDVRFVVNDNPTGEYNQFIPYVWFDNKWNIVGGGDVDLSNYPTKEEMNETIDVVDDKVDELSMTVDSINNRMDLVDDKISDIDETIHTMDSSITELSETVETFDNRITTVENEAHTHNNKEILDHTTASFTTDDEIKLVGIEDHANNYSLPKASSTVLGGIKVGDNLTIDSDGTLNATGGGSQYVLPPATTTTLGGVIVGNNIYVDENGIISIDSIPEPYELPKASSNTLGGIKVGNNLEILSDGTLNATGGSSITVDDHFDDTSTNPVQNRVLTPVLEALSREITPSDIDLWWRLEETHQLVMGPASIYTNGVVTNTPVMGPSTIEE